MRPDGAVCFAANSLDLPPAVTSCFREQYDRNSVVQGSIISDTNYAWLFRGPFLQVVDTKSSSKVSAWTFGAVVKDFKTKITCTVELPDSRPGGLTGPVRQLLVGLECELTGGMLCVFNLAGSRVLRAINIPSKVTALSLVSAGENSGPLHKFFKSVDGLAAVGTSDGQVLLIDLQRKKCDKALHFGSNSAWDCPRDELRPCSLTFLRSSKSQQQNYDVPDGHFCFHLNDRAFLKDQGLIIEFPNKESEAFIPEDPSVTSLLYVPQLASLCIGFACGTFQIWSLQSLSHLYSLPVEDPSPVVKMSFQEACDDPNAYCYLWVIRGRCSVIDGTASGPGCATLYSLCYDEKQWLPDYGYLYMHLMMCSPRFEYDLIGHEGTIGSRPIALHCVSRSAQGQSQVIGALSAEDSGSGTTSNTISLCLMVWETWGVSGPKSSCDPQNIHMALFDLNQWYVDQMPSRVSLRGGPSRNKMVAGYFVTYDMGEALSACEGLVLDLKLKPDSFLQFSSVQNLEEFSRPASLSFGSIILTDQQIIHLQHPGVQRALLSGLASAGPGALISPTHIFHECLALGLCPLLMDVSNSVNVSLEEQRTLILNVALEQHLGRFVCRCAREWADGRSAAAGCTLRWLLSAVWNRAAVLKQLAVRICTQLFDYSGFKLDSNAQCQLRHVLSVFRSIETLYQSVVNNKWHVSLNEWQQIELQKSAIELECQYYDVLQWFIDVDLLPEGHNSSVPYSSEEIGNFYRIRRQEISCLQQAKEEEENECETLVIDALLKNEPGGTNVSTDWEHDACGHVGLYPPISLQGLLRTFLVKDVSLNVKYSIVIYVLMDLADILDSQQYETALQKLMQFPAAFHMSLSSMRLTQAFWHLDHKGFDTAVDMLLDPLIATKDIKSWQHHFVVRLLLLQGQPRLALRYVRTRQPPIEGLCDIKMHLNLLLGNDLINEAFMFQRYHRSADVHNALLLRFFKGCEERDNLKSILQFSLEEDEEEALSHYLEHCKTSAADDLRVLYLLKRSRYVEALDVNQELRKKGKPSGTRDVVVNAFFKTLPAVTRKLATHCASQQNKLQSWKKVERPTPLFVNIKSTSPEMRYKSSFIQAAVEKSRETWSKLTDKLPSKLSDVESTPFLCTPRAGTKSRFSRAKIAVLPLASSDAGHVERKRPRDESNDDMNASKTKRIRFEELEGALFNLQHQQTLPKTPTRRSTFSCSDVLPLLHTPIVQRRSPASRDRFHQLILSNSPAVSNKTPQSIIKIRPSTDSTGSPSRGRILFKDPELTEEESECEPSPSQRRSKGESDTDSEVEDDSLVESKERGIVRRTIDFESESSSSESVLPSPCEESHFLPSHSPSPAVTPSQSSLSRMVVLSEAWKIGKPHNVTFGKDSVCVYDEDEPLSSEKAMHNESLSIEEDDTGYVDQEQSRTEVEVESRTEVVEQNAVEPISQPDPLSFRQGHDRLNSSGIMSLGSSALEMSASQSTSEVFLSADSIPSESLTSVSFRSSLSRPSIKEVSLKLSSALKNTHSQSSPLKISKDFGQHTDVGVKQSEEDSCNAPATSFFLDNSPLVSPFANISDRNGKDVMCSSSAESQTEREDQPCTYLSNPASHTAEIILVSDDKTEDVTQEIHSDLLLSNKPDVVELVDSASEESTLGYNDEVIGGHSEEKSESGEDIVELDQDESGFLPENSGMLTSFLDEDADQEPFAFSSKGVGSQFVLEGSQSSLLLGTKFKTTESSTASETTDFDPKFEVVHSQVYSLTKSDFETRDTCENLDEAIILESDDSNIKENLIAREASSSSSELKKHMGEGLEDSNNTDKSQPVVSAHTHICEETYEELIETNMQSSAVDLKLENITSEDQYLISSSSANVSHSTVLNISLEDSDKNSKVREDVDPPTEMPSLSLDLSSSDLEEKESFLSPEAKPLRSTDTELESSSPKGTRASQKDPGMSLSVKGRKSPSPSSDRSALNSSFSSEISGVSTRSKARAAASLHSLSPDRSPHMTRGKPSGTSIKISPSKLDEGVDTSSNKPSLVKSITDPVQSPRRSSRLRSSLNSEEVTTPTRRTHKSSLSSVASLDTSLEDGKSRKDFKKASSVTSEMSLDEEPHKLLQQKLAHISEDESISENIESRTVQESVKKRKISDVKSPETASKTSKQGKFESSSKSRVESVSEVEHHPIEAAILEYATSRRLTRHQHAMLARSLESSNDFVSNVKTTKFCHKDEEENLASDDDTTSVSSIRSSLRLREKYERQATASPSSTASTVINPALTPLSHRRRRQSSSDVSARDKDTSPVSSRKGRKSLPSPSPSTPSRQSTPSVRSAARRLSSSDISVDPRERDISPVSSRRGKRSIPSTSTPSRQSTPTIRSSACGSTRQSYEDDIQSLSTMSPSSTTSSSRRAQRRGRRLSLGSETSSEQFSFAMPDMKHVAAGKNTSDDVSDPESFTFSPPRMVTLPSISHSSTVDSAGSGSRRVTRQSRKSVLPVINEESSSTLSPNDPTSHSRQKKSTSRRRSWYFFEEEPENSFIEEPTQSSVSKIGNCKPRVYSAFAIRKEFTVKPLPAVSDSEEEEEKKTVRRRARSSKRSAIRRSSRNQLSSRRGRKRKS